MAVFIIPARIVSGPGTFNDLGAEISRLGVTRPLVVTDSAMAQLSPIERARRLLVDAGMEWNAFTGVEPDPAIQNVADGLDMVREARCDGLVAIGGGSSIDCAKAIAVMATNEGSIGDYAGINKIPSAPLPLVAVPTTAGTGSEVTRVCIITDTENDVKMLLIDPHLTPAVALVDPELTYTMPPGLTAATGVDALTHAIEAYVSVKHQPLSDALALSAIGRISGNLVRAFAVPDDVEARNETMQGALEAGMAFPNASVNLVHGMSRPIGACFHLPHGLSNAILLPTVVEFSLPGAPERFCDVAAAMGLDVCYDDLDDAGQTLVAALRQLNEDVEIGGPNDLDIDPDQWRELAPKMATDALASGSPNNNPRVPTHEEIVTLYLALLET